MRKNSESVLYMQKNKENTEYSEWAGVCKEAGESGGKERTITTIVKGNERRQCNECWEKTMKENKVENYKDGSIRIIPKEGHLEGRKRPHCKNIVDDIRRKNKEGEE